MIKKIEKLAKILIKNYLFWTKNCLVCDAVAQIFIDLYYI